MTITEETRNRLDTLETYRMMNSSREHSFDAIVGEAAALADAPMALISMVDDKRQWFKAKLGVDLDGTPIEHSICAHAIRGDETFVVPDASKDARFKDFPAVAADNGIRFYAGAPLRMRTGARVGTLCIIDVAPRADLDDAERAGLESLARRTVAAFELRRDMREAARERGVIADDYTPHDRVWLDEAGKLLAKASAALDHVGVSGPLAHLEQVIAMIDEIRANTTADPRTPQPDAPPIGGVR